MTTTGFVDLREWRDTFNTIADNLLGLGLIEICEITIETNGATGGIDVFVDGVVGTDALGNPDFGRRVLSITSSGVERVA